MWKAIKQLLRINELFARIKADLKKWLQTLLLYTMSECVLWQFA